MDSAATIRPRDSTSVFAIGIVLVLLAVALVFDSVWAAAMVFLALPMALGGVVAAFWITKTAFTREAAVGVILVVGLAVNHSILLIDAALQARRRNGNRLTMTDALHAATDRVTMIVLVTLTTLASLLPMAIGTKSDSLFGAIALATAGGTIAGTLGVMFLLPAMLMGFRRPRESGGGFGDGRKHKTRQTGKGRGGVWEFIRAGPQPRPTRRSRAHRYQEIISGNQSNPSYSFGLSATYTLFDGFARNHILREQQANEAAANATLTTTTFASDYTTTDAFFVALADQQLVVVAQSNVTAAEAQLRLASAKLHAGSGRLSDSLTALGTFLQARLGLLQARSNLVVGESNLGRLVGVPGRVAAIDDSAFYRVPPSVDTVAIRQEAMSMAPSIKSLLASVTAAHQDYKATKAGYFPTLDVSAAESWTGNDASNYSLVARRSLNIGFRFSPWTSLAREASIENASIRIVGAEASLADQRNFLAAQVNQAFAALGTAEETIAVSQASVTTGELNLRVVTDQYRIGGATITDVLTAQQQLVAAQGSEVQARYSYLRSKAQLEAILGRKL